MTGPEITDVLVREGKAWLFDEANINTDLIMPAEAFRKPVEEQVKMVFSTYRAGWSEAVSQGDVLVGGKNFGTGSSRPGAQLFALLGIGALVAESINGLFFRNCVNYALPALECPGVSDMIAEGDRVRVDVASGQIRNLSTGQSCHGEPMPEFLQAIIRAGGALEMLRQEGYIS